MLDNALTKPYLKKKLEKFTLESWSVPKLYEDKLIINKVLNSFACADQ